MPSDTITPFPGQGAPAYIKAGEAAHLINQITGRNISVGQVGPVVSAALVIGGEDIWGDLVRLDPGAEFDDVRDVYSELQRYLVNYSIRPRSIIHYRRSVFQENEEQLRITFDDELKIFRPPKGLYDTVPSLVEGDLGEPTRRIGKVILETKCQSGYPGWLGAALTHLLPRRISKFTTSMNLLHPREPSSGADPALRASNGYRIDSSAEGSHSPCERDMEDSREQHVVR